MNRRTNIISYEQTGFRKDRSNMQQTPAFTVEKASERIRGSITVIDFLQTFDSMIRVRV